MLFFYYKPLIDSFRFRQAEGKSRRAVWDQPNGPQNSQAKLAAVQMQKS